MKPIISIIVPVYNTENFLERCIQSILDQTFTNYELILVNDGSTDNNLVICNKFAALDSRVKVISQINKGVSAARNVGLRVAQGSYISFVDGDDYIAKNMLQVLYSLIIEKESKIAMCNFYMHDKDNVINTFYSASEKNKVINKEEAVKNLYSDDRMKYIVVWNKIFHCSIFDSIQFKEGIIFEDEQIIHQLYDLVENIVVTDIPLCFYRYNAESITHKSFTIKKQDIIDVYEERIKFLKDRGIYPSSYYAEIFFANSIFSFCKKLSSLDKIDHKVYINLNKKLRKQFSSLLSNPYYSTKSKIWMVIFCCFPKTYFLYLCKKIKTK